jgi:hypothetical protein
MTGGCLCGGARFAIDGPLTPIQLCHARRCRKASGGSFAPEIAVARSHFRWLQGEELISIYQAPLLREPPAYRRGFCRVCGSPLPLVDASAPFVVFLAGVLDDDPNTRPIRHIFTGQAAEWDAIRDELPRFDAHVPQEQKLPRREERH